MILSARRLLTRLFLALTGIAFLILIVDRWVQYSTRKQMFSNLAALPHCKVGLLLGTSKFASGGRINYYYKHRIDAAVALFEGKKIDYILVSGDNGNESYNEPETMQADLIAAGIPAERIVLDYAGFRTLDSILRCRKVFGEDHIIVISQPFHNARALFIANRKGMHALAYNAKDVSRHVSVKVMTREKFARVKMLIDLLFGKEPRFYGPRVPIG